jgi:streptogramin lyase
MPNDQDPNTIRGMHPWYIFQDSYEDIWVGMLAVGLDKFDKATETFKHYISVPEDPNSLNSPNIKVIFEDSKKRFWVGTEGGGLHKFNRENENFVRYVNMADNPQSLSNNDVRAIFEDKKGRLWIGTGIGLDLMDTEKSSFKIITVNDGLPGNTINGILEDQSGNLWVSTNMGISKFNPDSMTFRNYDITDGLQGNEFNYTAQMQTSSGEFYFGGKNGFNVFNPDEIKDNPYIPNVVLTDFQLFNKSVEKRKTTVNGKRVYRTISELKEIKVSYKENVIGFEFASLDFGNAKKNKRS